MEAVLMSDGVRVTAGSGAHMLRLGETHRLLGDRHDALFERLDIQRGVRNDVSYYAGIVTHGEVEALRKATRELLELARRHVEG